jgi:hypothetical protein
LSVLFQQTQLFGGIFDLGINCYASALHGELDPLPVFVVTPTDKTADRDFVWLNPTQCVAVGRVDIKALRLD